VGHIPETQVSRSYTAKEIKNLEAELDRNVLGRLKDNEKIVPIRNDDGTCVECGQAELDVHEILDKDGENPHEAGCIMRKIEREIQNARAEWLEVVTKIPEAQAEYDAAVAAETKYKNPDKAIPDKVVHQTETKVAALWGWMDRKVVLENTIKKCLSPVEHERRRNISNRLQEVRRVATNGKKKETARDQGVPGTYLGANGNFKPGLDARYKSDLITSALGEKIGPKGLHQFTKESALERLAQRNWLPHLEKAKKNREAKAAKETAKAKATPARRSSSKKSSTPTKRTASRKAA
jgi:hypothetical protein